jgi:hypothetical protein
MQWIAKTNDVAAWQCLERYQRDLIPLQNNQEDTMLHVAAASGSLEVCERKDVRVPIPLMIDCV